MTQTVRSCGECPFSDDYLHQCNHPKIEKYLNTESYQDRIHPSCPVLAQFPDMDGFEIEIKPIKK